jgi:aldehyde dehydrogenase (NAD+)
MNERLLRRRELFIGGQWVESTSKERLEVVSPSSEAVVGEVPLATNADMDRAVAAARKAFDEGPWPRMRPSERADVLARAAEELRKRAPDIAFTTLEEMGCPVSQAARAQTGLVAPTFDYYADLIRTFEFERKVIVGERAGLVAQQPIGVVGAIVAWNAPVLLSAWKVAPALAAGCTIVIKPPPEAPLSNFVLAEALQAAGVPDGVVSVVPGGRELGEYLVQHPDVDKIAFTGSTGAGMRIMAACAEQMKRVSLELGGKSAAIVLDDADMATVIPNVVRGGVHLSGQFCGAQSRILIPRARYAELAELAVKVAASVVVGDPHDPTTTVGPLVAERQRARVEGLIQQAVSEGARVLIGGGRPAHLSKGWYVQPTILADVENSMTIAQEEVFGPVLCLIAHDGDDDAVRIANASRYGLAGGVWSGSDQRALDVARRLRTGSVTVNGTPAPFPHVPFGGLKQSGLGRELGPDGLNSYLEPKSMGFPPKLWA